MKKLNILSAFVATLMAFGVSAQTDMGLSSNETVLGFVPGNAYDDNGGVFAEGNETFTGDIGVLLTPADLSLYKGCKVVGMRVAAHTTLGRVPCFLRTIEGGTLSEVKNQRQRIYDGWNRVDFNGDQYEIKGTEMLFFGYTYTETPELRTQAGDVGILAMKADAASANAFVLYDSGNFYSISEGALCVQLIIDASSLPEFNMMAGFIDTGFKYKEAGEQIEVFTNFKNVGKAPITSYELSATIDNGTPVTETVTLEEPLAVGGTATYSVFVNAPAAIGSHALTIAVTSLNGQAAPVHDGISSTQTFAVYKESYPRQKLWMDVFTDQANPYAGTFMPLLEEFQSMPDAANVIVASHYAAKNPLACQGSEWWYDLYAFDCPVFTSNRALFPGEGNVAYSISDYVLTLPFIIPSLLCDMTYQDTLTPSFATMDINGSYDKDTRKLTVTVSGDLLPEARAIMGDVALTAMLIEDKVSSRQQYFAEENGVYSPKTSLLYTHDNVVRAYLSDAKGTSIDATGDKYTQTFEYELPASYKPENLEVAVYMARKGDTATPATLADYDIVQANSVRVAESFSGVDEIMADDAAADTDAAPEYYNLQGQRLPAVPATGLYLERRGTRTLKRLAR